MSATVKKAPLPLLGFICILPTIQTVVAVHWEWNTTVTYPILKGLMVVTPVVVWVALRRTRSEVKDIAGWKRTNFLHGLVLGAAMAGLVLLGYVVIFRHLLDPSFVLAKVRSLGVLEHYWLMALAISLWNSLLEEYYWRAFIIGELRCWLRNTWVLCIAGGMLFGLHHAFALLSICEWPFVVLGALGTMVAGGAWSWMRVRGYSILDCYVSHVLVDLAIMSVGYDLIRQAR